VVKTNKSFFQAHFGLGLHIWPPWVFPRSSSLNYPRSPLQVISNR